MNVDDVRRTLARQANALEGEAQGDRLAGVRGRVTAMRRRRAAGSVAGVAGLAVAAVAVGSQLTGVTAPAETGPALNPPIRSSAPAYPEENGDRSLLGSTVGAVGDSRISLSVTPDTLDLEWGADCYRPARPGARLIYERLVFAFDINGHETGGVACDTSPSVGTTTMGLSVEELRSYGVRPGVPLVVTARIETRAGAPVTLGDAILGLAVYAGPAAPSHVSPDAALGRQVTHDGTTYRLASTNRYELVDPRGSAQAALAASDEDRLVVWGGRDFAVPVRLGLFINGIREGTVSVEPAAMVTHRLVISSAAGYTVTVRVVDGQPTSGKLLTGIYERVG